MGEQWRMELGAERRQMRRQKQRRRRTRRPVLDVRPVGGGSGCRGAAAGKRSGERITISTITSLYVHTLIVDMCARAPESGFQRFPYKPEQQAVIQSFVHETMRRIGPHITCSRLQSNDPVMTGAEQRPGIRPDSLAGDAIANVRHVRRRPSALPPSFGVGVDGIRTAQRAEWVLGYSFLWCVCVFVCACPCTVGP